MLDTPHPHDPYKGCEPVSGYHLVEEIGIGEGRIGRVYKAVRSDPKDIYACKVIPEGKLKKGWERELQKVTRLRGMSSVAQYHMHGVNFDQNNRPFVWILSDYIDGRNLKQCLAETPEIITIAFIERVGQVILEVLYACKQEDIVHGDLHLGNILISNPDSRFIGSPRRVVITDFGYGGSHNEIEPKDDFRQFFGIIHSLLGKIKWEALDSRNRIFCDKLTVFLDKKVLEFDPTQGHYVGNVGSLIADYGVLSPAATQESIAMAKQKETKGPGDYLVAEALGENREEWKALFVPEFLAAQDLLSRNTTVLTGARGCGKTMVFRRLTAYMDKVIGEISGVPGADQFVGFYLNCRGLVEAFPWLPKNLNKPMQEQIMHFFHLSWLGEVCRTLKVCEEGNNDGFDWLEAFLLEWFAGRYRPALQGADVVAHVQVFLETEKERCRRVDLGALQGFEHWPLARIDSLDGFLEGLQRNVSWIGRRPLYFFLDDYTIPLIPRHVQRVLNPIVFKRRDQLFFKISTESANSFERESLRRKPLEVHDDFDLIDLASESIHQRESEKGRLLERIFDPRIDRESHLRGKGLELKDLLEKTPSSNNALARQMREAVEEGKKKKILYHGVSTFVGIWASDIRIMIQVFSDMLREARTSWKRGDYRIPKGIQDKTYRAAGGEFLVFTEHLVDPALMEKKPLVSKREESYGNHLRDIVEAFVNVSRFELTEGKLVKNEGRLNPKQAFRLEIVDKFSLPERVIPFYEGLTRWHIFLQDWRGKSVRGMITPRLFLHRVLIPFCQLTFSSHDNIQLRNEEFITLLERPEEFLSYWKKKRRGPRDDGQASLWDS